MNGNRMLSTLVIATVFLYISSTDAGTLLESHNYPETQIYSNWPWRETTRVAYARCNKSHPELGKRCIVRLQLNAFENSKSLSNECEVHLKPEMSQGQVDEGLMAMDFGKDKTLVVWLETQNTSDSKNQILKTSVIHMLDNCRTFETKVRKYAGHPITLGWNRCRHLSVVVFEDTYEIVLTNNCTSGFECTGEYSLYKFDSRSKIISGPEYWPDPPNPETNGYSFVIPVESRQPEKGYFILNQNDTGFSTELMVKQSDGYKKQELWRTLPNETIMYSDQFTATNRAIGLCHQSKNLSYICWQSDQEGVVNIRTLFNLHTTHKNRLSNVYNTRDGEILHVAQITCADDASCDVASDRFYLTKISKNGSTKTLEVQYDTKCCCESCTYTRLFENEAGQYCIGRICNSKFNEPAHVDTSVRCYSKDAFSD